MKDTRVCVFFWKQRPKSYKSSCAAISRADKKGNRRSIETQTARCDSDCSNKGMDLMTITAMWWNYCMEERWVSNPDEFQVATNPMTIKIRVYEPTREFRDGGNGHD